MKDWNGGVEVSARCWPPPAYAGPLYVPVCMYVCGRCRAMCAVSVTIQQQCRRFNDSQSVPSFHFHPHLKTMPPRKIIRKKTKMEGRVSSRDKKIVSRRQGDINFSPTVLLATDSPMRRRVESYCRRHPTLTDRFSTHNITRTVYRRING